LVKDSKILEKADILYSQLKQQNYSPKLNKITRESFVKHTPFEIGKEGGFLSMSSRIPFSIVSFKRKNGKKNVDISCLK